MKRDLKADLELCNKATPGPWEVFPPLCGPEEQIVYQVDIGPYPRGGNKPRENMIFIAQAREGWPHAIERAMKAEALARELVEDLERARGNLLLVLAGAEPDPKRYEIFLRKCTRTLTKAKEVLEDD